jgi:dihydrodipicolinate synthase/N-acetylneuraminate lyase
MSIHGILPVIPTPLRDGAFDAESFRRFLDHMLPHVDGYTLLGSTGEAPSMSTSEREEIAAQALALTPEGKSVVVGVTDTALGESVRLARHAAEHGAAGVLCASPFYFPNTRDGLGEHLEALAAATDVEIVFYDNPTPTQTVVSADQIIEYAAQIPRLNSVKLTDHALDKVAVWQEAGLTVLAGDDPILFRFLRAGVDGAMVIAPAIFPAAFRAVWERRAAGDLSGALEVFSEEIAPFLHVFGIGDEIATTKAILSELGIFASAETRLPLRPTDADRRELLVDAYRLCTARTEQRTGVPVLSA